MSSPLRNFFLTIPLAVLTLLIPSFFGTQAVIATALLLIVGFVMLALKWNKRSVLLYIAVAIGGPIAESIAIYFGAWAYAQPDFLGMPFWLPFVWGNASIYMLRLKQLIDFFVK